MKEYKTAKELIELGSDERTV